MKLTLTETGTFGRGIFAGENTLEVPPVVGLIGANGCGKSSTLDALAVGAGIVKRSDSKWSYRSGPELAERVGKITIDPPSDSVFFYRSTIACSLPPAVSSEEELFRARLFFRKSHGEASLNFLAQGIYTPTVRALEAGKSVLLLLDEIEDGLTPEAEIVVVRKLTDLAVQYPVALRMVFATKSFVVYHYLSRIESKIFDIGGWLSFNPFDHFELRTRWKSQDELR